MRNARPLLWLSSGLDLLGVLFAALVAVKLRHNDLNLIWNLDGLIFVAGYLFFAWFLGAYSFLRWPWMPYRQVAQRFGLIVVCSLGLAIAAGWVLNVSASAIWFHRSTLAILGLVLTGWGMVQRVWIQPLARLQAEALRAASPVARPRNPRLRPQQISLGTQRHLLLLVVAYHPSQFEVDQLRSCLEDLGPQIGYAVVVNDYRPGEPAAQLAVGADFFLANRDNPGYGRAVNRLVVRLGALPAFIGVLNTDLYWQPESFERMLTWLMENPSVTLAVPQILDESGEITKLCKQNPTLLGLLSRRFVPNWLKPNWLRRYDRWYEMADFDYSTILDATYLSGCCMLVRSDAFRAAGGFDERYFLYLEDADLTRTLAREGRCVHLPISQVVHGWGRGNYRNLDLMAVNLASAWHYFRKWGWQLW